MKCRICGCGTTTIHKSHFPGFDTSQSLRATTVEILHCTSCGHLQKHVTKLEVDALDNAYKTNYAQEKIGTHINVSLGGDISSRHEIRAVRILEKLDVDKISGRVHFDIGAGSGEFSAALLRVGKGDWKSHAHEVSQARLRELEQSGCERLYSGALSRIKHRYDLVTLFHVVEHVPFPVRLLREARALLKPGGTLVCAVPSFEFVNSDFFLSEHLHHFTPATLTLAAEMAGLRLNDPNPSFLAANEIGFSALPGVDSVRVALDAISYAEALPAAIEKHSRVGRQLGIFGLSGTGQWLAKYAKDRLSFIVDEDPMKIGRTFVGLPIISPRMVEAGTTVLVILNNANQSAEIAARLRSNYSHFDVVTCFD